jgi:hypothetical protein
MTVLPGVCVDGGGARFVEVTHRNLKETAVPGSWVVGLEIIPAGNDHCAGSAPATDDQFAVKLLVELLLPALPCRHALALGDIGLMRLPMADRSKPGQVRGQHCRHMICSRADRQIWQGGRQHCADRSHLPARASRQRPDLRPPCRLSVSGSRCRTWRHSFGEGSG